MGCGKNNDIVDNDKIVEQQQMERENSSRSGELLATYIVLGPGWSHQTPFHQPKTNKSIILPPETRARPSRSPASYSFRKHGGQGSNVKV